MKLWKLTQNEATGYDTYDSVVVAAETEQDAVKTHPSPWSHQKDSGWGYTYSCWASSPDNVQATLIGTAIEGTPAGVMLASFNAG